MARIIPNENTWIGFAADAGIVDQDAPKASEVADAIDLASLVHQPSTPLRAATRCPLPRSTVSSRPALLAPRRRRSTRTSTETTRTTLLAWETLPRGQRGYIPTSRRPVRRQGSQQPADRTATRSRSGR